MCHRMMTIAQIDESSTLLDLGHQDSAIVALYSRSIDKGSFFWSIFETSIFSRGEDLQSPSSWPLCAKISHSLTEQNPSFQN